MNLTAVEQLGKHYNEQGPSGDSLDDLQIIPSSWLMPLDPRKWELDGSGHSFLEDNKSTADHVNSKWKLGKHHTMHRNSTDKALSETESEPPNQDIANKTEQSSTSTVPMLLEGSYTFSEDEELPWKHIDNLGRGGFGSVDRVRHVQSGQIMARKVLRYHPRQAKRVKAEFEKEIAHLKKLNQHKHIVRLVCSYQQGCDFGILLLPVAPGNLYEFLQKRVSDEEQQRYFKDLYQSFGCLLSGLSFIHSNGIRHKDIKPQNILVDPQSPSKFLFTDFGLSRDFSDLSQSYTSGRPDAFSSRYCAPEVAAYTQRGRKADIFSLGCVFIEIVAVLCGNTPDYLENVVLANIGDEQADTMSFSAHHEGVVSWISQERARQRDERALLPPLSLCETMIRENPSDRPHLNILLPQIKRLQEAPYLYFCEHCHFELDLEIRSGGWPSNYQPPWIINDLKLQVHKIATGESKFSNTVQHIVQYTIEINAIHPPGVGYIAEVIFEAALYDCNTPPYQLCSRLILSRFAYLLNQLNITVTIPKDRGFQSLVGQLCQTEFGRATRISDCAEEDGLAMRKQRCLRFMQLLGRLYGYELVPTVDIVDCLSSLLKSMQAPTEFGVEKLVILLTTVGTFLVEHPEGQFIVESSIAKLWLLAKSAPLCLSTRSRDLLMV